MENSDSEDSLLNVPPHVPPWKPEEHVGFLSLVTVVLEIRSEQLRSGCRNRTTASRTDSRTWERPENDLRTEFCAAVQVLCCFFFFSSVGNHNTDKKVFKQPLGGAARHHVFGAIE